MSKTRIDCGINFKFIFNLLYINSVGERGRVIGTEDALVVKEW